MPTETDYAWLAGVIDGEGSVALTWVGKARVPGLKIMIYGSDETLMGKVRGILAGAPVPFSFSTDDRALRSNGKVSIASAGCIALYPLVSPYLVRQISRYKSGVDFLEPRYATASLYHFSWSPEDRDVWRSIRAAHGLTDS